MEQIQQYRDMLQDGNPAELLELKGEELWTTPRGPKNATLERCDLGLGPGKLEGAYAQLPRYFADTGKVEDVESRLVSCMIALQGLSSEQATDGWHKRESDMEALVTFVATKSKGHKIDVPAAHPREAQTYGIGEEIFFRRSGPLDFSCATCHSHDDKRIRLQDLPNLATAQGAQMSMAYWPAYRVSQSAVWGMERRLIDCMRQMRFPDADFLSDAVIALQVYMQKNASGATLQAPGIKR
jgi:sulfur-oxidizing protein SoxA